MFKNKRGNEVIDWTISVAIFLLYLGWFFVFLRPNLDEGMGDYAQNEKIYSRLYAGATEQVKSIPLFIDSYYNLPYQFVEVPVRGEAGNFNSINSPSSYEYDRLFLVKNLSVGRNTELINYGEYMYTDTPAYDLVSADNFTSVDSKNFKADFEQGQIKRAYFEDKMRIKNANVKVDGINFDQFYFNHSQRSAFSKYDSISSSVWIMSFVPPRNSRIIIYAQKQLNQSHELSFLFEIDRYPNFMFDNLNSGQIRENMSYCMEHNSSMMDLFSDTEGLLFTLSKTAKVLLCNSNETGLSLNMTFRLDRDVKLGIFFHQGDDSSIPLLISPYTASFGSINERTAFSWNKVVAKSKTDYAALQKEFGLQNNTNFRIRFTNSTSTEYLEGRGGDLFSFGKDRPTGTRVNSKFVEENMLGEDGTLFPVTVIINSWTQNR